MTKSWRAVLPIHPAAELFPRMSDAELAALAEDIKANGLKSPIVLWSPESKNPPRYALDGINRLDAMEREGIQFLTDKGEPINLYSQTKAEKKALTIGESSRMKKGEQFEPQPDTDPYAFVISANIHRRHLTAEQKRELIAKLIKATPEKSDRQIAETVKADHKTVGAVRAEQETRGEIPHVATRTDSKGRQQPARKATMRSAKQRADAERARQTKMIQEGKFKRVGPFVMADDIGPASNGEIARKDARIEELQAEKRKLEIENVGLRSEVEDAMAARKPKRAPDGKRAAYCSFCLKRQDEVDTLIAGEAKTVCICNECVDECVDIIKQQKAAAAHEDATPPPDDGLDIPASLRRGTP